MIKLAYVIHPREGWTNEQSRTHWRDVHAPIVVKIPRLVKYVQKHATRGIGSEVPFLGIGELWFRTEADAEAALADPIMAEIVADGALFTEQERAWRVWVEELEFDGPAATSCDGPGGEDLNI